MSGVQLSLSGLPLGDDEVAKPASRPAWERAAMPSMTRLASPCLRGARSRPRSATKSPGAMGGRRDDAARSRAALLPSQRDS
jgi:hypothetical protein